MDSTVSIEVVEKEYDSSGMINNSFKYGLMVCVIQVE